MTATRTPALSDVRGAVYIPARAFNAYQAWREYDPEEVERDVGYAAELNLNALRVFCSYEYWCEAPDGHERAVDHLLDAAAERGVRIVPILFESAGREPTPGNLTDDDPTTACAVRSPSGVVIREEWRPRGLRGPYGVSRTLRGVLRGGHRWERPAAFVEAFAERYGDDDRLLALEIVNEPGGWAPREEFAEAMLRTAADHGGDVPLTMGCKSLSNNRRYDDPSLDVFQFHCNLPPTEEDMAEKLSGVSEFAESADREVWLSEWQRTREEPPDVLLPNYSSLAETIRNGPVDGSFFWSLLLKPAYLPKPRQRGRVNGVFHEDGSVWNAADARAIAGDETAAFEERGTLPPWVSEALHSDT